MQSHQNRWLRGIAAGFTLFSLAACAPQIAHASDHGCSALPEALGQDPLSGKGFQVLETSKLYRRQDRPWSFIPTGSRVLVRAPFGLSEADLFRVASCHVGAQSPLAVPGAKLGITRIGDTYELRITSDQRSAALEIQHRAEAL